MRFGLLFLAVLLVSCGSDNPVGGSDQPTGGGNEAVTIESLIINAKLDADPVTTIRPGGGLIVAGSSTSKNLNLNPVDVPLTYPVEFNQVGETSIAVPKVNSCKVTLFLKLSASSEMTFEVHTQWSDDTQRIDCWVFEAEMRQSGLQATMAQVKVGARDVIKTVGLLVAP